MAFDVSGLNMMLDALGASIDSVSLHTLDLLELSGGSPPYERQRVRWLPARDGIKATAEAMSFDIPAGSVVASFAFWAGGERVATGDLVQETYVSAGQYLLSVAKLILGGPSV